MGLCNISRLKNVNFDLNNSSIKSKGCRVKIPNGSLWGFKTQKSERGSGAGEIGVFYILYSQQKQKLQIQQLLHRESFSFVWSRWKSENKFKRVLIGTWLNAKL